MPLAGKGVTSSERAHRCSVRRGNAEGMWLCSAATTAYSICSVWYR